MNTYAGRNAALRAMGYATYKDYLESALWGSIKSRALDYHGHHCRFCQRPTDTLHHISYGAGTLQGTDLSQLAPICGKCHRSIEFTARGKKRTLVQAQTAYQRIWKVVRDKPGAKSSWGKCEVCGGTAQRKRSMCRPCQRGYEPGRPKWARKTEKGFWLCCGRPASGNECLKCANRNPHVAQLAKKWRLKDQVRRLTKALCGNKK